MVLIFFLFFDSATSVDMISLLGTSKAFMLQHKKLKICLQNTNNFSGKLI